MIKTPPGDLPKSTWIIPQNWNILHLNVLSALHFPRKFELHIGSFHDTVLIAICQRNCYHIVFDLRDQYLPVSCETLERLILPNEH